MAFTRPASSYISGTLVKHQVILRRAILAKCTYIQHLKSQNRKSGLTGRAMATSQTGTFDKNTPESKWREILGTEEYRILRQKGTEPAGSGEYNKHEEDGFYRCGGCGTELYKSETKFNSGCGWPAFYAEIPGTVERHVDNTLGMKRTEITCAKCGGHLGHVFENEGFQNPTNERHCVNSKSLKFQKA